MKNKKNLVLLSALGVFAVFVGAVLSYKYFESKRLGFMAQENAEVFVRDYSPKMGAENPEVYLVEFLDPECESCAAFYPYVKEIMADYGDKVQLVARYAPFHGNSKFAAKILEAAREQGKYWETMEILFRYLPNWGSHHNPQPELIWHYLPQAGVDVEQIKKDMKNPEIEKRIEQDIQDGRKLGVRGTPTFYINGAPLQEFGPDKLREAIERELKKE